jgi:glycosyltransferase involved in cell wall biosynthesis
MRIAFVIQRFGDGITGGAESLAKQLADELIARMGWEIDVYTSRAQSYQTWANAFPAGESRQGKLRVLRFHNLFERNSLFYFYDRVLRPTILRLARSERFKYLSYFLESIWFVLQGPFCPGLLRSLRRDQEQYQAIFFMTYLYYPSVFGCPSLRAKAVLMPHAHDEGPLYFRLIRRLFQTAPKILTNTEPEQQLIARAVGLAPWQEIAWTGGVGFDPASYQPRDQVSRAAQPPYLLYLGRLSQGKGVHNLIQWFLSARDLPAGCRLVLAGHLDPDLTIPSDPRIDYLGYVSDEKRMELIRDARVVVNLSAHESLSLIVIEAMSCEVPVIVNQNCEVLRYYTEKTTTAFPCDDESSFHAALRKVIGTDWTQVSHHQALQASRNWALEHFSWDRICDLFKKYSASS